MKNNPNLTPVIVTILLASLLLCLSACASAPPTASASPTPSANTASASDRPQQYTSPRGVAELTLNGKKISVDYGRPSMHGRKIMGELVPYDQVWRTGANKATHLTTEADLIIGNVAVPKGTYTLFTIPSPKGWKLIINKQTGQWGTPYEYEKSELARIDMPVETIASPVEQFTISLNQVGEGGVLKFEWEQTRASAQFTVKK